MTQFQSTFRLIRSEIFFFNSKSVNDTYSSNFSTASKSWKSFWFFLIPGYRKKELVMDFIYLLLFVFTGSRKFAIISQQKCVVPPTVPTFPLTQPSEQFQLTGRKTERQYFSNKASNWFRAALIRSKCPLSAVTVRSDQSSDTLNST
jgi:hypothetical protein